MPQKKTDRWQKAKFTLAALTHISAEKNESVDLSSPMRFVANAIV
jgi:hypothetical protein